MELVYLYPSFFTFGCRLKEGSAYYLLHAGFLRGLFFDPDDGGDMFLRNVCSFSTDFTALYPPLLEPHILQPTKEIIWRHAAPSC
jgi:hypothetical protein